MKGRLGGKIFEEGVVMVLVINTLFFKCSTGRDKVFVVLVVFFSPQVVFGL